jgi:hypothetical protein
MGEVVYNETIEEWRDVPGYEGRYLVSNQGAVKSIVKYNEGHILKPGHQSCGYLQVILTDDNKKKKSKYVHCVVWEAFRGKIPESFEINHLNEDKTDNRLCNLELVDRKTNCNWGTRNQRISSGNSKWIIKLSKNNEILHFYPSLIRASRDTGINISCICECCNGKQDTAGGFVWKYAE